MFKYTTCSMEDLAEDISGFIISGVLWNLPKIRPVMEDMSTEEEMAMHKLLIEAIVDRLRASEG